MIRSERDLNTYLQKLRAKVNVLPSWLQISYQKTLQYIKTRYKCMMNLNGKHDPLKILFNKDSFFDSNCSRQTKLRNENVVH